MNKRQKTIKPKNKQESKTEKDFTLGLATPIVALCISFLKVADHLLVHRISKQWRHVATHSCFSWPLIFRIDEMMQGIPASKNCLVAATSFFRSGLILQPLSSVVAWGGKWSRWTCDTSHDRYGNIPSTWPKIRESSAMNQSMQSLDIRITLNFKREAPMTGWLLFMRETRPLIIKELGISIPMFSNTDTPYQSAELARRWKKLAEDEKTVWKDRAQFLSNSADPQLTPADSTRLNLGPLLTASQRLETLAIKTVGHVYVSEIMESPTSLVKFSLDIGGILGGASIIDLVNYIIYRSPKLEHVELTCSLQFLLSKNSKNKWNDSLQRLGQILKNLTIYKTGIKSQSYWSRSRNDLLIILGTIGKSLNYLRFEKYLTAKEIVTLSAEFDRNSMFLKSLKRFSVHGLTKRAIESFPNFKTKYLDSRGIVFEIKKNAKRACKII